MSKENQEVNSAVKGSRGLRSSRLAANGIGTSAAFAAVMEAVVSDALAGRIDAAEGRVAMQAASLYLRTKELELRYRTAKPQAAQTFLGDGK